MLINSMVIETVEATVLCILLTKGPKRNEPKEGVKKAELRRHTCTFNKLQTVCKRAHDPR